ncbi:XRE family transcriptional regulator [uncultured Thiodictyon sp.]|jgi:Zn-dependent peptidase ImmA (M78 family)/transcriptional regulator with XRE-family HTH domain|uniref:XRE family transcriptional regulator n=1 Tax=uncultured Thiodictyon sp. TaxID=1846217 RepID=UPI0025FB7ECC|nr:XRE family transcriptional regulator [uncultured Thiodictyon sp.]
MRELERLAPVELGRRLKAARNAARVTQDQAAERIGAVRTTIVAIERGDRRLSAEDLLGLCDLYQTSPGGLLRPDAIHVDLAVQLRRLPAVGADQDAVDVSRVLHTLAARYVELERKLGRPLEPAYPPVWRLARGQVQEQAEDAAMDLRGRLGIGHLPIPDLLGLIETELRIRLFIVPLPSSVSGAYAYHEALDACILVNANHALTRQAWTAAHELGHFQTDRRNGEVLLEQGGGEKGEGVADDHFAKLFAGAFLMPAAAVRARYRDLCEGQGKFSPRSLVYLARSFYVAPEAMARRLEQLRLFKKGTFDALRTSGFDGSAIRRILGDATVPSPPRFLPRYTLIAVEAYEQELISEGELAQMLRIGRIETREIVASLADLWEPLDEVRLAHG